MAGTGADVQLDRTALTAPRRPRRLAGSVSLMAGTGADVKLDRTALTAPRGSCRADPTSGAAWPAACRWSPGRVPTSSLTAPRRAAPRRPAGRAWAVREAGGRGVTAAPATATRPGLALDAALPRR